ncbi:aromatic-ring-hydroxylating dioxygenase subunit beta [Sphingobium nicotianae]|uniref:Aromatic-ring-hydroxylating dioxygenase subunit beta n=1 Tax=Sphingobium nicotianae TaxID=2782607 RepID=A0A9X1IT78_9SPHN|nr:aromatic-ring-hydroxylating dioxygenase subunit beta [Sphingobium nicotianae]MBT2189042.1 aromatic-ring-hydroxylating dioxygenase subunit beta [Sphingobium nicotianae]
MNDLTLERARLTLADAQALITREARLLDEQDFAGWLDLYTEDALYWMPAWRDDNSQTEDPDRELSLIYYRGRSNLRDRVTRLTSGLSPVSRTLPRVAHILSNVELGGMDGDEHVVFSSFVTHAYDPRSDRLSYHFGRYRHGLRQVDGEWRIASKIIRLANDLVPTVLDVNAI